MLGARKTPAMPVQSRQFLPGAQRNIDDSHGEPDGSRQHCRRFAYCSRSCRNHVGHDRKSRLVTRFGDFRLDVVIDAGVGVLERHLAGDYLADAANKRAVIGIRPFPARQASELQAPSYLRIGRKR